MVLKRILLWGIPILFIFVPTYFASAASLTIEPSHGSVVVGGTFDVSIYLDTEGESINALDIFLQFPPEKLQMVSPATGNSIVGVWTSQPRFNNQDGTVRLQGGVPRGINVSRGLVATLTFRARGVGNAVIKFGAESKILANDGRGTDVLEQTQNGVFELNLPPPLGPNVVSPTHPNQSIWYQARTVILNWAPDDEVGGYSYILNDIPIDSPDNISEGSKESISYKDLVDGRYFFHIKALRDGSWGGVTHFAIKIDSTPPAKFPIEIIPGARTSRAQPVIQFGTSDSGSGLQRYEVKIVPLQIRPGEEKLLFVEATSPYIPQVLGLGSYDVIVRAFDEAGNEREIIKRLRVVPTVLRLTSGEGIELRSRLILPWEAAWALIAVALISLIRVAIRTRAWHDKIHAQHFLKELPNELKEKFEQLKNYKEKYGKHLIAILLCLFLGSFGQIVSAQAEPIGPPIVTSVSENVSNEEIFYIGGKAENANSKIIIYLQNARTLETQNFNVEADKRGEWFYRHSGFLAPGEYILWAQSSLGEVLSPPSPQVKLVVHQTALEIGASRFSYELLYLIIALASFALMLFFLTNTLIHWNRGKKKHRAMLKEISEAEEALKRSFAVLRRDIQAQLAVMHRIRESNALSEGERQKEEQLLRDLDWAEKHAGKEVFDLERMERA